MIRIMARARSAASEAGHCRILGARPTKRNRPTQDSPDHHTADMSAGTSPWRPAHPDTRARTAHAKLHHRRASSPGAPSMEKHADLLDLPKPIRSARPRCASTSSGDAPGRPGTSAASTADTNPRGPPGASPQRPALRPCEAREACADPCAPVPEHGSTAHPAPQRPGGLADPVDQVHERVVCLGLRDDAPVDTLSSGPYRSRIAADQRVPVRQRLALGHEAIGAGLR